MSQVQFLRGKNEETLGRVPLTPGAIFFTEETNHLYIDTDTARLPVKSDFICGRVFWVKLSGGEGWVEFPAAEEGQSADYKQTVYTYYDKSNSEGIEGKNISNVLTDDSILFIGKSTYGEANADGTIPAIVAESSTTDSITFRLLNIGSRDENNNIQIDIPDQDIWIQLYCPNPNPQSENYVPADVLRTAFTTRVRIVGGSWEKRNEKLFEQTISIPNIDFTTQPFFVNLSDDSLENRAEFQLMKMEVVDGKIKFSSENYIAFNIEVDICIILALGGNANFTITDLNGPDNPDREWISLAVTNTSNVISDAASLSNVAPGEERELLVFCTNDSEANKNDFAKIESINYETSSQNSEKGTYTFVLADGETIENGFDCVIIQLNNIANINTGTLKGDAVEDMPEEEKPEKYINGWQQVTSKLNYTGEMPRAAQVDTGAKFRYQYWPTAIEDSDLLIGKHMPIVMPIHDTDIDRFDKICETKIYSNRIQFVVKEEDYQKYFKGKDLEIKVIDFI